MELTAYLGTVTAMVTLALGSMWVVASVLGRRIDDLGAPLGARIDDQGARLDRLASQNDAIFGAVGDLAQRVAHLESRRS
jgi:hypothetical protein